VSKPQGRIFGETTVQRDPVDPNLANLRTREANKNSAALGVISASDLENSTLKKKNENKKIDNSGPNQFFSGKLPNRSVT